MDLYDVAVARKLSSGGGGGSSDFSTAEVTITNVTRTDVACAIPFVDNVYEDAEVLTIIPMDEEKTYNVILYKGSAYFEIDSENITVTGDLSTEDNGIIVTGNGTITIS